MRPKTLLATESEGKPADDAWTVDAIEKGAAFK